MSMKKLAILFSFVAASVTLIGLFTAVQEFLSANRWAIMLVGTTWSISISILPILAILFALVKIFRPKPMMVEHNENGLLPMIKIGNLFINPNLVQHPVWRMNRNGMVDVIAEGDPRSWLAHRLASLNRGGVSQKMISNDTEALALAEPQMIELIESADQVGIISAIAGEIPANA